MTNVVPEINAVANWDNGDGFNAYGVVIAAKMRSPGGEEAMVVGRAYRTLDGCIGRDTTPSLEVMIVEPTSLRVKRRVYPAY